MTPTIVPFNVQRKELSRYLQISNGFTWFILWATVTPFLIGVTLVETASPARWIMFHLVWLSLSGIALIVLMSLYYKKYTASLSYQLEGNTLRIKQGVFVWQHKAIPLDRITDIMMTQGVIMRRFGLWRIDVQTASQGAMGAEGTLHGIGNPKHIREVLLAARDSAVRQQHIQQQVPTQSDWVPKGITG